jgi:AcrR family transcriptional regulator
LNARRPRRPITPERIVAAAAKVVRSYGLDGLNMRRLSQELGCSVGAAYHHVPSKEAIIELVAERTLGQLPTPGPDHGDWADRIEVMLVASWNLYRRYPGLDKVLEGSGKRQVRRLWRFTSQLLAESGLPPADIPLVQSLIGHFAIGVVAEVSYRPRNARQVIDTATRALELTLDGLREQIATGRGWMAVSPAK